MLFIDAGNTLLKAAIYDGLGWQRLVQMPIAALLAGEALPTLTPSPSVKTWWACVVAGEAVKTKLHAWAAAHQATIRFVVATANTHDMVNTYQPPESLGSDRYCALLGARRWQLDTHAQHAVLVASFGTAMTLDYLSATGVFEGGSIAPGLMLQRQALAQHTAQLPTLSDKNPLPTDDENDGFANHTVAAISVGTWQSLQGALMCAWQKACKRSGENLPSLILTGGNAETLAQKLQQGQALTPEPRTFLYSPHLVFAGLKHLAQSDSS